MDDYKIYSVRSSAVLTNSYVAGTVIGDPNLIYEKNQLVILVGFTIGSLTSGGIKVEFSPDGTTYYNEAYDDIATSTGVISERLITRTFSATGNYRIAIPIKDRYIKISAIGTGTVTNSLMSISAVVGVNQ